jgi:ubiquinone/menaquinone biosynthesis C-methylase UbiE/uncharacterized protein YbaR (Trm112 family)
MKISLTPKLRCIRCGDGQLEAHEFSSDDGRCRSGILVCKGCSAWYPIEDFVLELLPEGAEEPGRRKEFFADHRDDLERLRVPEPEEGGRPNRPFEAQAKQREHFDELARREDEFSYTTSVGGTPFWRALRERIFGEWLSLVPQGSLLLDIGCADGLSTFPMARPDVEILAFDISRQSLLRAQAEAEARGLRNVTFFVADANDIPVRDETVDGVLCFGSLHHVPDPGRTLADANRVLSPGGRYLGLENNKTPLRPIFDFLMRLRPLWKEEAGTEAQIGEADLQRWTGGSDLRVASRPIVFVPPHLCNWIGVSRARRLLRWTDALLGRIPGVRRWGGLIEILGRKESSAAPAHDVLGAQGQPSESALQS